MIEGLSWYAPSTIVCVNLIFWLYWVFGVSIALKRTGVLNRGRIVSLVGVSLIGWLLLQGTLAYSGFYRAGTSPRFLYGIMPPLTAICVILVWPRVRTVLEAIPLSLMTYIHTVRAAVELVVWVLYVHETTPRLMTFAGKNLDIVIGLTAPIIGYLCFTKKRLSPKVALGWHILGLGFLVNVSILFVFSAPSPFQLLKGEFENIGFFYFPFIWAPTHGVPTVILTHCLAILRLWHAISNDESL